MLDQPAVDGSTILARAGSDLPASLDPQGYIYTIDDEQALRRLAARGQAHLVLCCCAEYVASCDQERCLTARWQKVKSSAGDDQKAAKVPFFGGANGKGLKWQHHPANARDLDIQLDERRGLVGILPDSIGCIVFDADSRPRRRRRAADSDCSAIDSLGELSLAPKPGAAISGTSCPRGTARITTVTSLTASHAAKFALQTGIRVVVATVCIAGTASREHGRRSLSRWPLSRSNRPFKKNLGQPPTGHTRRKTTPRLGHRQCDQGWEAERLASTSPGSRHNALASFMGHYRSTTPPEQWPQVLDYLRPAFLEAKPEGSQEFDKLAEYFEATEAAKPLRRLRAAHSNGHTEACPHTPPNGEAQQTAIESAEYNALKKWLAPCLETITSTHDAARLIFCFADQLVIAYDPESPEAKSDVYAVLANTGRLSNGAERSQQLLNELSDRYLLEINAGDLKPSEFAACCKAARALREANSIKRLAAVMPGTVAELRR